MAQKKAHEVDAWIARRDPEKSLLLVYGPDRGLVSERAARIVASTGVSTEDPFSVVRLDATEADQTPGRLFEELRTVPMFADLRLVWLRNATATMKGLAESVKALSVEPPRDALLVIEAGDLRKGTALRTAVEGSGVGMALPCYADESRDMDTLIDETMHQAGLLIELDARQMLKRNLGGDRLASRGELEKLVLYTMGARQVTAEDVLASAGDVSGKSSDDAVDAVLSGNLDAFDRAFMRLAASGSQAANQILGTALRQFHVLQAMRGSMDSENRGAASVVASARPPVFFTRRKIVESFLGRWDPAAIVRALSSLQAAILQSRMRPDLAEAIARQSLLALAMESARRARQ